MLNDLVSIYFIVYKSIFHYWSNKFLKKNKTKQNKTKQNKT